MTLRCYIDYQQDNWEDWLYLAEFVYNNLVHSTIWQTPFFANHDTNPNDIVTLIANNGAEANVPDAANLAQHRADALTLAKESMEAARQRMLALSQQRQSQRPEYHVGQWVLLSTANLNVKQPSRKLSDKFCGPFEIEALVGNRDVRLTMPTFNGCTTFHVDRVKPYIDPTAFPGCPGPDRPPPTIGDNGKEEWEVHKILDSRRYYRKLQYFVSYKGWGKEDMQWRPAEEFDYDNKAVLDSRRSTHRRRRSPSRSPRGSSLVIK